MVEHKMIETASMSQNVGEEYIHKVANEMKMTERNYLLKVAQNSFVLVKKNKKGIYSYACQPTGTPIVFDSYEAAQEERDFYIEDGYFHANFDIITEFEYLESIAATEIFLFAIVV